jgi:hypothetical protein
MLLMITNREMLFQPDNNIILKVKPNFKTMLCNQEMEKIQSFLLKEKLNTISQKTLEISQMLTIITNKETYYRLVTNTIHKAKLTSKTTLCNQETATDTL